LAEAVIYPADVRDACAMQAVADDFMRRHDCPDIVIANAGVSRRNVTQFSEDSQVFETILATNVLGIVNLFHPYLTAMRASGHGVLVGVASIGGIAVSRREAVLIQLPKPPLSATWKVCA
jgi:NAD(P)-dependent dehydrogenase (short-subunit alcohol dehydrogenase family)